MGHLNKKCIMCYNTINTFIKHGGINHSVLYKIKKM